MKNKFAAAGAAVLLGVSAQAFAAPVTSSADPALSGGTVIDFESQAPGSFTSLTIGNVTFSPSGGDGSGNIAPWGGSYNATGVYALENGAIGFTSLTLTFASPVSAFGFNWGASNEDWSLTAYDSGSALLESYILPQTWWSNAGEFYGLNTANISYAVLTQLTHVNDAGTDWIIMDNFTFADGGTGPGPAVPEPSTLLLLAGGLAGLCFARKKFKK